MGEYAGDRSGERVAVVFFGIVLLMQTVMLYVLAKHAEREGLFGSDAADEEEEESRLKYQLAPSLIFYAVATGSGLLFPYLGLAPVSCDRGLPRHPHLHGAAVDGGRQELTAALGRAPRPRAPQP